MHNYIGCICLYLLLYRHCLHSHKDFLDFDPSPTSGRLQVKFPLSWNLYDFLDFKSESFIKNFIFLPFTFVRLLRKGETWLISSRLAPSGVLSRLAFKEFHPTNQLSVFVCFGSPQNTQSYNYRIECYLVI